MPYSSEFFERLFDETIIDTSLRTRIDNSAQFTVHQNPDKTHEQRKTNTAQLTTKQDPGEIPKERIDPTAQLTAKQNPDETPEERIENALRSGDVLLYRQKRYKCGEMLYLEVFPIWNGKKDFHRAKKLCETRKEQEVVNGRNVQKKLMRMANKYFTRGDLYATFTYDGDAPDGIEQVKRDVRNFLKRLRRRRSKLNLPELRYIYVIEGEPGIRYHVHFFISGDLDRDELERMWHHSRRNQTRRLAPDDFGLGGLACYLGKPKQLRKYEKCWAHSQNIRDVTPTIADRKIKKRQAEAAAINEDTAREIFERKYPGYRFVGMKTAYTRFLAGCYLYVTMRRR